jgi:hypothetical protein
MAAGLIGILVTVSYVHWMLKWHQEQAWRTVDTQIQSRIQVFLNSLLSGLRSALGFDLDILDERVMRSMDPILMSREVMRIGAEVIAPSVRNRLDILTPDQWRRLAQHLHSSFQQITRIMDAFGSRLRPKHYSSLLEIQNELRAAMTFYEVFPDMAGVPEHMLPRSKTPPEVLKRQGYESTAHHIRKVIHDVVELDCSLQDV